MQRPEPVIPLASLSSKELHRYYSTLKNPTELEQTLFIRLSLQEDIELDRDSLENDYDDLKDKYAELLSDIENTKNAFDNLDTNMQPLIRRLYQ